MTSRNSKTGKRKKKGKSTKRKMRRKKKLKEESSTDSQTKIIAPHLHLGKSESFINAQENKSSKPQNDSIGQTRSSRSSKKEVMSKLSHTDNIVSKICAPYFFTI